MTEYTPAQLARFFRKHEGNIVCEALLAELLAMDVREEQIREIPRKYQKEG
jgi:hypothetical protein